MNKDKRIEELEDKIDDLEDENSSEFPMWAAILIGFLIGMTFTVLIMEIPSDIVKEGVLDDACEIISGVNGTTADVTEWNKLVCKLPKIDVITKSSKVIIQGEMN